MAPPPVVFFFFFSFYFYRWSHLPQRGVLGKFLCNLEERVALGQAGPRRKPSPLLSHCSGGVNLSGICWESGGPVLSCAVFTGCSVPCLSKEDIFTNQEDAVMIKQFLVSVAVEDERVRLICPSCPRSLSVFIKLKSGSDTNLCL